MLGVPNYTDQGHELNRWLRIAAPWTVAAVFALVIVMQQFLRTVREDTQTEPPESVRVSEEVREPGIEGLVLLSKQAVKAREAGFDVDWDDVIRSIDAAAGSRTDRMRAAIVVGELKGKQDAVERLRALKSELAAESDLRTDIDWVLRLYRKGRDDLPSTAVDSLIARHGWFGRLAMGYGASVNDGYRAQTVKGMPAIERAMQVRVLFHLGAFVLGIITTAAMAAALGKRGLSGGFESASLHPSIYLETFGIDMLLFLLTVCVQTLTLWLSGVASVAALSLNEILIWSTLLSAAWPFVRGMSWVHVAPDLGLTRGKDVVTEVCWGVIAFLVMAPAGAIVNVIIGAAMAVMGMDGDGAPRGFPSYEQPLNGSWIPVVLGVLGSVVLAPVGEELMFRGAFYQYLRTRWGAAAGVLISSAAFGAVHPYTGEGLIAVGVMGVFFALLREWRGSLIAGIVAHALHNGTLDLFNIWTISAIAG